MWVQAINTCGERILEKDALFCDALGHRLLPTGESHGMGVWISTILSVFLVEPGGGGVVEEWLDVFPIYN